MQVLYLRTIRLRPQATRPDTFPFQLPVVAGWTPLELRAPVTFFVGENGSGKSTVLEAIAAGVGSITVGAQDVLRDETLKPARTLGDQFQFSWSKRTRRGFFLRAEDFFNFSKRLRDMTSELDDLAKGYDKTLSGYGRQLATGSVLAQKRALEEKYGKDLDANSHGESFLKLFRERFVPGGLYLLDEPEAPLSPQRQLMFLSMLKEMIAADAQFIIATHSPILMAFPDAEILSFDQPPIKPVAYADIDHVTLTKAFLNNPDSFLRHL